MDVGTHVRLSELQKSNPELFSGPSSGMSESSSRDRNEDNGGGDCDDTEYTYLEQTMPIIESAVANEFDQYRQKYLGFFRLGNDRTYIVNFEGEGHRCNRYVNTYAVRGDRSTTDKTMAAFQCIAAVKLASTGTNGTSHHLLRLDINSKFDEADDAYAKQNANKKKDFQIFKSDDDQSNLKKIETRKTTGFFTKVSRKRNREKVNRKMQPFFNNFEKMDSFVEYKIKSRGFKPGDDVILMVMNTGEVDLFFNFACSCKFHGISLEKVIVLSANEEIVNIIENTGALAFHHNGFVDVNSKPSGDYLDFIFVDMMWYKSFALYMVLKRGLNVLFQDVDLVWFRDPFPYLKNIINDPTYPTPVDAIFTDDGQRGIRYSPFYANSGFYYIKYSERSKYWAYSIMTAFPMIQRTGSHQNVFTMRLQESLDIQGGLRTKLLLLQDFPNGLYYHHNKSYMVDFLVNKKHKPYNFHMCWTQRKADKVNYLKKTLMWYLNDEIATLDYLGAKKGVKSVISPFHSKPQSAKKGKANWEQKLSNLVCKRSDDSP